jgi:hypothetical protein
VAEIIARISAENGVELTQDGVAKIDAAGSITPFDAAYLARGIFACAAALCGTNPPKPGAIVGDTHIPIMAWGVGNSNITGDPVLTLSVPPGIELTFVLTRQGAQELGAALVKQMEGAMPPGGLRGTVH